MINLTDTHNFISHPATATPARAVIVDAILSANPQPTVVQTRFNLRLVFESECAAADGMRYCVWSRPYPYCLRENSLLRRDLKKLLGRDFDPRGIEHLDAETLVGRGAYLLIAHARSKRGGYLYARIALMRPDPNPIPPSGRYTRVKDRTKPNEKLLPS